MNCIRNNSLVQCFPTFVMTVLVSILSFENPLMIMSLLEFTSLSNYWLAVVIVPATIPFTSVLFGNANVLN